MLKRGKILIDSFKKLKDILTITIGIRLSVTDHHSEKSLVLEDYKHLVLTLNLYVDYWNISSGGIFLSLI